MFSRPWAFWRRVQYGTGFCAFWAIVCTGVYYMYFYQPPNCFDGILNGEERGLDCGGACTRICAFDIIPPNVKWVESFRVTEGQYNAVGYIENRNEEAATPEIAYTIALYDDQGLITENSGTTILPPDSVYPVFVGRVQTGDRVPTRTELELEEADLWLPATVGRDQFTVINRRLYSADARPRLEATIRNEALIEAKHVEVVATIFDVRGNPLTSSRTFVENFAPKTEETVVFTWPEPIAKTVRSCEVPTDVVLAIDLSGSMNNDGGDPPQPITDVLNAGKTFVDRLRYLDQASVVTFATNAVTNIALTNDIEKVRDAILGLRISPNEETGSTNTGDAFVRAQEVLSSARHNEDARKVLVLLTDGLATGPGDDPETYAKEKAALLKAEEVDVYVIGLGEQVNMDFIREIATDSSFAYQAITSKQVEQIYKDITGAICEDGPAIIDIVTKTDASFVPLQ